MLDRRQCLVGLAAGAVCTVLPRPSSASIAYALTLTELATTSHHALVATPRDSYCQWEQVGKGRRLVTYTRVQVEELLDERDPADSELLVRTLGGRVGKVAQLVPGEAELLIGKTSSLFLEPNPDNGMMVVTAMSQGHYPLRADLRGVLRLRPSPHLPDLRNAEQSAARILGGRTVRDVRELVTKALAEKR